MLGEPKAAVEARETICQEVALPFQGNGCDYEAHVIEWRAGDCWELIRKPQVVGCYRSVMMKKRATKTIIVLN